MNKLLSRLRERLADFREWIDDRSTWRFIRIFKNTGRVFVGRTPADLPN